MEETEEPTVPSEPIRPLLLGAGVVLTMVAAWAIVVVALFSGWTDRGQFGDMFGGINAIFSGLAFASLAYALYLQRRELSLQRLELALTRRELRKQADAQADHAATALRAAQITGLGALYQGYSAMWTGNASHLIGVDPVNEIRRVQAQLVELLDEEKRGGTGPRKKAKGA